MTKEDLNNVKIVLCCPECRRKFQEHCFKLGIDWSYLGCEPQTPKRLDSPFFAIEDGRLATFEHSNQFIFSSYKQIFFDDVLSIPIPKKEYEFELFERVLVRDNDSETWIYDIFSNYNDEDEYCKYLCIGSRWDQCIPYKGNEHLLGTTKDAE